MKKIAFIFGVTAMAFVAACSNQGAYSEEEKQAQDSADNERQEDKFKEMEQQMAKDSMNGKMVPGGNMPMPAPDPNKEEKIRPQEKPVPPPPPKTSLETDIK